MENNWVVYILQCSDKIKSLYIGSTNNIEKRLKTHNNAKGAKFTRGRLPVILLKIFSVSDKSEALKLEAKIKKLSRKEKFKLVNNNG